MLKSTFGFDENRRSEELMSLQDDNHQKDPYIRHIVVCLLYEADKNHQNNK